MDFLSVLEIIVVTICAITYGFMLFFKVRGNVLGAVRSHPARGAWIEMPKSRAGASARSVAPRKGCVD